MKAFTSNPSEGNPAGVVLDADRLSDDDCLHIARTLNFSESVFVQRSDEADHRFRFFSPTQEVDLCAHATIAAMNCLYPNQTRSLTIQTRAAILPIQIENGMVWMTQKSAEVVSYKHDIERIAHMLGTHRSKLVAMIDGEQSHCPIETVSTGVPKILVPIDSLESLFRLRPDLDAIKQYCVDSRSRGVYVFTFETKGEGFVHTRQFNPLSGINEDPATGVAAGALGAYFTLHDIPMPEGNKFIIEQGQIMGKPGKIFVDASSSPVRVGGTAVISEVRDISL